MRCFIGIDLGSTTTKAVVMDEQQNVIGRGITNSRSNYDTAAAVAKEEALLNSRFYLFRHAAGSGALNGALDAFIEQLERDFRSSSTWSSCRTWKRPACATCDGAHFGAATEAWARRCGRCSAGCTRRPLPVRAGRQAQERLLSRHRRQPVPAIGETVARSRAPATTSC